MTDLKKFIREVAEEKDAKAEDRFGRLESALAGRLDNVERATVNLAQKVDSSLSGDS